MLGELGGEVLKEHYITSPGSGKTQPHVNKIFFSEYHQITSL